MRAVICNTLGAPDTLTIGEIEPPRLADGTVRIAVTAAGLNFADTLIIAGKYQIKPEPPFSPGFEVAGEALECGRGVRHIRPGDRVMAVLAYGGFAEEVIAPASQVFRLPRNVDDVTAASFPVAYGTSHLGLTYKAGLKEGEMLVVHGAAGGVGLTAVEIGKIIGATVIATAGSAEKLKIAAEHGADHLIDYRAQDIRERVKVLTGERGADVIYDPVGGEVFDASLRCTAPGGRILIVGFASGTVPQIPANILLVKNISALGFYWGAHLQLAPEAMAASFNQLLSWLGKGWLRPHVSETYELADAAKALAALGSRRTTGKVVLTVKR